MENKRYYLEYALQPQLSSRFPLAWPEIFSREAPLAVEIGFGNGEFLVNWARQVPEWDFIGFEISMASMERALKRLHQQQIPNARPVHQDARFGLREFFGDNTLSHVMMNFPDPWPKKRHHKRRLIQPPLVATLAAKLKRGGYIHCATDWEEYAQQMLDVLSADPALENTAADYAPRPEYRPLTKFEQRGIRLGHGVWDLVFRKK